MLINPSVTDVIFFIILNCILAYRINDLLKEHLDSTLAQIISLIAIFHPFSIASLFFVNKYQLIIGNIFFIEHLIQNEKKAEVKSLFFISLGTLFNISLLPISIYYFIKNISPFKKFILYYIFIVCVLALYLGTLFNYLNFNFLSFFVAYFNNLLIPAIATVFNYGLANINFNYAYFFLAISLILVLFNRQLKFLRPYGVYFFLCLPMIYFYNWHSINYEFENILFNPYSLFPTLFITLLLLCQLAKKALALVYLAFIVYCSWFWLGAAPSTSSWVEVSQNNLPVSSNIDLFEVGKLKIVYLKNEKKLKEAEEIADNLSKQAENPMLVRERLNEYLK